MFQTNNPQEQEIKNKTKNQFMYHKCKTNNYNTIFTTCPNKGQCMNFENNVMEMKMYLLPPCHTIMDRRRDSTLSLSLSPFSPKSLTRFPNPFFNIYVLCYPPLLVYGVQLAGCFRPHSESRPLIWSIPFDFCPK